VIWKFVEMFDRNLDLPERLEPLDKLRASSPAERRLSMTDALVPASS